VRTRKAQATEQIATVELEKLLDISAREGRAQPVSPIERDDVEIIKEEEPARPKKFAESSGVAKPGRPYALAVPVPVAEGDDDDLAIPVEEAPAIIEPPPAAVVEQAPEPVRSRRLFWLTLLVALIASGVIAARMFGL
jgi:hypothetical protein